MKYQPGKILLLGSGETSHPGGQAFETLIQGIKTPIHIRLLETPAGFELNSARVSGRVADYLNIRLQNYQPDIQLVAARRKGGEFSTDSPLYCDQIADADVVFFGAGSPSYTIRQLADSRIWQSIQAAFFQGACLALASAATISISKYALPVYEIYKVGEDPFWNNGLNFLSLFGLDVSFIPHWNNNDGGAEIDTSRCFMGRERFEKMASGLPMGHPIVGLDEQTGLILDFHNRTGKVVGKGSVHVWVDEHPFHFGEEDVFNLERLGEFKDAEISSIPEDVRYAVEQIRVLRIAAPELLDIPMEVAILVEERQKARTARDWMSSDQIRDQLTKLGWKVIDTPDGPKVDPIR
jgi:cyanophycinase-like exopeptidase